LATQEGPKGREQQIILATSFAQTSQTTIKQVTRRKTEEMNVETEEKEEREVIDSKQLTEKTDKRDKRGEIRLTETMDMRE